MVGDLEQAVYTLLQYARPTVFQIACTKSHAVSSVREFPLLHSISLRLELWVRHAKTSLWGWTLHFPPSLQGWIFLHLLEGCMII